MQLPTIALFLLSPVLSLQNPPGEEPAIGQRMTQADFEGGVYTEVDLRLFGQKMFSTPFNKLDGYGDGPMDPFNPTDPGGRPSLQNNGTFLRVNGLDAQTCIECHAVGSNAVVPFRFAIGGVGGSNSNAMGGAKNIDVDDEAGAGSASYDGRFINPPFLFGSGGVELLAKEMTSDLQRLKRFAALQPDVPLALNTHGVSFGSITLNSSTGALDLSQVEGVDLDLVVRPFGRKGEFSSVRDFDLGAMEFHFGMQPAESVGAGVDDDGDGVVDEVLAGEISALHLFNVTLKRPVEDVLTPAGQVGKELFSTIGCADCHVPSIQSRKRSLQLTFPEESAEPFLNTYYSVALGLGTNAGFEAVPGSGLDVKLFSDLKRHRMGPALAETTGGALDDQFITARLWGIADTAPYMHDGRATTLTEAILLHGGESQNSRDAFDSLSDAYKVNLLTYLRSLRTPLDPTGGL